jgi:hypothetical protein
MRMRTGVGFVPVKETLPVISAAVAASTGAAAGAAGAASFACSAGGACVPPPQPAKTRPRASEEYQDNLLLIISLFPLSCEIKIPARALETEKTSILPAEIMLAMDSGRPAFHFIVIAKQIQDNGLEAGLAG